MARSCSPAPRELRQRSSYLRRLPCPVDLVQRSCSDGPRRPPSASRSSSQNGERISSNKLIPRCRALSAHGLWDDVGATSSQAPLRPPALPRSSGYTASIDALPFEQVVMPIKMELMQAAPSRGPADAPWSPGLSSLTGRRAPARSSDIPGGCTFHPTDPKCPAAELSLPLEPHESPVKAQVRRVIESYQQPPVRTIQKMPLRDIVDCLAKGETPRHTSRSSSTPPSTCAGESVTASGSSRAPSRCNSRPTSASSAGRSECVPRDVSDNDLEMRVEQAAGYFRSVRNATERARSAEDIEARLAAARQRIATGQTARPVPLPRPPVAPQIAAAEASKVTSEAAPTFALQDDAAAAAVVEVSRRPLSLMEKCGYGLKPRENDAMTSPLKDKQVDVKQKENRGSLIGALKVEVGTGDLLARLAANRGVQTSDKGQTGWHSSVRKRVAQ